MTKEPFHFSGLQAVPQEIKLLEASLRKIGQQCVEEMRMREALKEDPEYVEAYLKKEEAERVIRQKEEGISDSREEYAEAKKNLLRRMRERNVSYLPGWKLSFETKKEVNKARLWEALGGDVDLFSTLANVTQKAVRDFADSNPAFAKSLKDCIEDKGAVVSDLEQDISRNRL